MGQRAASLALAAVALAGCQTAETPRVDVFRPAYAGVETRLLEGDLVNFIVAMRGARDDKDVTDYAECAAAQYALIRGFGFARHVRTTVQEEGGLWSGDAVYTVSPDLPRGLRTIDAEVVVDNCLAQGIPTV
ncbi:hypothetical protein JANAI62_33780 [Jannaschia pagri]|uniref:Lipoprotein n=1 Tax=Jannaschia pagri TaxID=2829797 RepID=A0ABQ4NQR6_9RHOB|nr:MULTISPECIES: hypothetical protein [unclassified Jannaschia]GIT92920.1 hypothetical protein JANAI61_33780 [Jannaschia sp. AI_61]GIT96755.1 hypothetical protein JANAI62_33780 [Jannaschia sp. AI_62]